MERRKRKIHTTHERTLIALSRAAIQLPMSNVLCAYGNVSMLCTHSHSHCTLRSWCGYQSIQSKVELYHNDTHLKWSEVEKMERMEECERAATSITSIPQSMNQTIEISRIFK